MMSALRLTYYGDDFTGSTDVMEALTLGGVPTVLFLQPPDAAMLQTHFPQAQAVGVAGVSRSMSPEQMDAELPPQFRALQALGAPLFHYKICSTFDSAPRVGSIGHATEIGWRIFQPSVVPMMVGAPALRRYLVFGNLFATVNDSTYRLDRHPTMSKHPATPMHESDLRLHLGQQTPRPIGLLDVLHLAQSDEALARHFAELVAAGCEIVLLDTLDTSHLPKIGRLVWSLTGERPVFTVASSGIEYALVAYWQQIGAIQPITPPAAVPDCGQLIVVSGSAAPGTATQLQWAQAHGYHCIRLDAPALIDPAQAESARETATTAALTTLGNGHSVILYSAWGPDDPALAATRAHMLDLGLDPQRVGAYLGVQQGRLLRTLLERTGLRRACVTGGDTCGYAARQLELFALEIIMPVAPGAPLCRARSHLAQFDGLEIALKAGQVGKPDYLDAIRRGYA